jgi:LysM repeat protein
MLVHKVRYPGESVSIIAGWYTGEIDNWKVLAEANPGLNPNVINEGMKINIPESMLKTREPMTREYVDSFYPKLKSKSKGTGSRGQSSTPADEETPVFGPKQ